MLIVLLSQIVYKTPIIALLMNQHQEWQMAYRVFFLRFDCLYKTTPVARRPLINKNQSQQNNRYTNREKKIYIELDNDQ